MPLNSLTVEQLRRLRSLAARQQRPWRLSEQTIKALAGHVSRQMLERYSYIRSQAKQAPIQTLELPYIEPILRETGHKMGTVTRARKQTLKLIRLKQLVGPPGFEPGTNGL